MLSFQDPRSPHLTLRFWRELLQIEYEQITAQSRKIADRTEPFSIHVNGVDTFGRRGDERVLFLTVAFSPELAAVKKLCPWPNPPQQKEFRPHITLARIRHPQKFAVHHKSIFKALGRVDFTATFMGLRFYAEVEGRRQTSLEDFSFHAVSS